MKSYKRKNHEKSVSPIRIHEEKLSSRGNEDRYSIRGGDERYSIRGGNEEKLSRASDDYRRLFLNLSEDYEVLMKKYNVLEK